MAEFCVHFPWRTPAVTQETNAKLDHPVKGLSDRFNKCQSVFFEITNYSGSLVHLLEQH